MLRLMFLVPLVLAVSCSEYDMDNLSFANEKPASLSIQQSFDLSYDELRVKVQEDTEDFSPPWLSVYRAGDSLQFVAKFKEGRFFVDLNYMKDELLVASSDFCEKPEEKATRIIQLSLGENTIEPAVCNADGAMLRGIRELD